MLVVIVKSIDAVIHNSCDEEGRSVLLRVSFLSGMVILVMMLNTIFLGESNRGILKRSEVVSVAVVAVV